jgi:hypothetical protein
MEKKKSKGIKEKQGLESGLLTIHFEKIVLEKACELETRVSKPLERKFGFEVETIPS